MEGVIKGDTKCLDYSSYIPRVQITAVSPYISRVAKGPCDLGVVPQDIRRRVARGEAHRQAQCWGCFFTTVLPLRVQGSK